MSDSVSAGYDAYEDYCTLCKRKGVTPLGIHDFKSWRKDEEFLEKIQDISEFESILAKYARDKRMQAGSIQGEIVNLQNKLKMVEYEAASLENELLKLRKIRGLNDSR